MARWVVANDADQQSDPDSDVEELDVGDAEQHLNLDHSAPNEAQLDAPARKKISIKIGGSATQGTDVCHVRSSSNYPICCLAFSTCQSPLLVLKFKYKQPQKSNRYADNEATLQAS